MPAAGCGYPGCAVPSPLCLSVPRCAIPHCVRHDVLCRGVPCHTVCAVMCHAMPCHAMLCRATPCCARFRSKRQEDPSWATFRRDSELSPPCPCQRVSPSPARMVAGAGSAAAHWVREPKQPQTRWQGWHLRGREPKRPQTCWQGWHLRGLCGWDPEPRGGAVGPVVPMQEAQSCMGWPCQHHGGVGLVDAAGPGRRWAGAGGLAGCPGQDASR